MKRGLRAASVAACAALLTVCSFMTADAAAVRLFQPAGEGMIAVCHALPLEATPYELRLVPNDDDLGGHLAHLDRPLDPASLSWPDIIPAPQDGSGESYCPGRAPAAPDVEPPADPVDPPVDAPATEPPATEPPAATQPATAPVTTTDPPADAPADTQADGPSPDRAVETESVAETPVAVTRLPVTGSGAAAGDSAMISLLVAGATVLFASVSACPVVARRTRR